MKAILIDHDDSFTYNLRDWLRPAFAEVDVWNHRDLEVSPPHPVMGQQNSNELSKFLIVLSPGPKSPEDYPHVHKFLSSLSSNQAVFGVCLGMQLMVENSGGKVSTYTPPLHGKKSKLQAQHEVTKKFNSLEVARYHSLQCSLPETFEALAVSAEEKIPMIIRHNKKKWLGFQFHPESFMTEKPELFLDYLKSWYL